MVLYAICSSHIRQGGDQIASPLTSRLSVRIGRTGWVTSAFDPCSRQHDVRILVPWWNSCWNSLHCCEELCICLTTKIFPDKLSVLRNIRSPLSAARFTRCRAKLLMSLWKSTICPWSISVLRVKLSSARCCLRSTVLLSIGLRQETQQHQVVYASRFKHWWLWRADPRVVEFCERCRGFEGLGFFAGTLGGLTWILDDFFISHSASLYGSRIVCLQSVVGTFCAHFVHVHTRHACSDCCRSVSFRTYMCSQHHSSMLMLSSGRIRHWTCRKKAE